MRWWWYPMFITVVLGLFLWSVSQSATDVVTCKTVAYVRVKFQCDLFRSLWVCVIVCVQTTPTSMDTISASDPRDLHKIQNRGKSIALIITPICHCRYLLSHHHFLHYCHQQLHQKYVSNYMQLYFLPLYFHNFRFNAVYLCVLICCPLWQEVTMLSQLFFVCCSISITMFH